MRQIQLPPAVGFVAAVTVGLTAFLPTQSKLADRVAALETEVATLGDRVDALTVLKVVTVDCGAGQTVQAALFSVPETVRLQVDVYGTCTENVVVPRNRTLIRGATAGSGITAKNPAQPVIRLAVGPGNSTLLLRDLTIAGGSDGVLVEFGGVLRMIDCIVSGNTRGVHADHQAVVGIQTSLLTNNFGAGASAANGSHLSIEGGTIQDTSGGDLSGVGVVIETGSTATIGASAIIKSSGFRGISLSRNSVLTLNDATITGSALTGIFASGGATIVLGKGATITTNLGSGISLMDTSIVHKNRSEADIHITNNGGWGIACSLDPAVAQIVGFAFQTGDISGNAAGNINCRISPGPLAQ